MRSFTFGMYYQDEQLPYQIAWVPYRKVITANGVRYDLISKMILFTDNLYSGLWEAEEKEKELTNKLWNNAFTGLERRKLFESMDRHGSNTPIHYPNFKDIFFTFNGPENYIYNVQPASHTELKASNNLLETEPTRWAANGNAYSLSNPSVSALAAFSQFSNSPTWQISYTSPGGNYRFGVIRKTSYAGYILDTSVSSGIHGIRPCISLYEDQIDTLRILYGKTTATIKEPHRAKSKPASAEEILTSNTKIHISR